MKNYNWYGIGITDENEDLFEKMSNDSLCVVVNNWMIAVHHDNLDLIVEKYDLNKEKIDGCAEYFDIYNLFHDYIVNEGDFGLYEILGLLPFGQVKHEVIKIVDALTSEQLSRINLKDLIEKVAKIILIPALQNKINQFQEDIA